MLSIFIFFSALYLIIVSCMFSTMYLVNKDYQIRPKCVSSRGFAPDPAGGAHDAPPNPLVDWEGDIPPHTPLYSVDRPIGAPLLFQTS